MPIESLMKRFKNIENGTMEASLALPSKKEKISLVSLFGGTENLIKITDSLRRSHFSMY